MKVFDDDEIEFVTSAISYFNELDDKTKVTIVSNMNPNDNPILNSPKLSTLLNIIARKIGEHVETIISNELMELGLDNTYAILLVTNMKKHYPQLNSMLLDIANIDDEKFAKIFPEIVHELLHQRPNADKFDCSDMQYASLKNLATNMLNGVCRGVHIDELKRAVQGKLSGKKIDVLFNTVSVNQKYWYDALVFMNTQNSASDFQTIKQDLTSIKSMIRQLADLLVSRR